jgi:hypothetical protein
VHVSDVRQIGVHTAQSLVSGHRYLEVEIAVTKLKKYKYPGSQSFIVVVVCYQILAELILQSTNSLILLGIRKNCLISVSSLLLYQFTNRVQ